MNIGGKKEAIFLFVGDIILLIFTLWLTLFVRYFELPEGEAFFSHVRPFLFIFIIWIIVFYIADLYKGRTLVIRQKLPRVILNVQIINSMIAVTFFYLIPYFGITPKTILFIYLVLSFALMSLWRVYLVDIFYRGRKSKALIVANGNEVDELISEINGNPKYKTEIIRFKGHNAQDILDKTQKENISTIIINLRSRESDAVASNLYELLFSKVRIIDTHSLYEEIFERVPLSLLQDNWFLEHVSNQEKKAYDISKRIMDFVFSFVLFILSLPFYPIVALAIKIDDRGKVFIYQNRVGEMGNNIKLIKFRTMIKNDESVSGKNGNEVTRVGNFLRKSRIDELPQLWNVLRGDISLIGPRPELERAVRHYNENISYYSIRFLIQPGLSGWAQIYHDAHPHHGTDTEETKNKLSHDLYYIKNRSFILDFKIALKTIKTLLSRSGV